MNHIPCRSALPLIVLTFSAAAILCFNNRVRGEVPHADAATRKRGSAYTETLQNFYYKNHSTKLERQDVSFDMVPIPAGTFSMGSPIDEPGHRPGESPAHEVAIKAFWMSPHEVTADLFWVLYNDQRRLNDKVPRFAQAKSWCEVPKFFRSPFRGNSRDSSPIAGLTQYGA